MSSPLSWGLVLSCLLFNHFDGVAGKYHCGKTSFNETTGSFSTPNYNRTMQGTIQCTYEIKVPGWVRLDWYSFHVNGRMPHCYEAFA